MAKTLHFLEILPHCLKARPEGGIIDKVYTKVWLAFDPVAAGYDDRMLPPVQARRLDLSVQ